MERSTRVVHLVGKEEDVMRELGWLQQWLPEVLGGNCGGPLTWIVNSGDLYPDVVIHCGPFRTSFPTITSRNGPLRDVVRLWVLGPDELYAATAATSATGQPYQPANDHHPQAPGAAPIRVDACILAEEDTPEYKAPNGLAVERWICISPLHRLLLRERKTLLTGAPPPEVLSSLTELALMQLDQVQPLAVDSAYTAIAALGERFAQLSKQTDDSMRSLKAAVQHTFWQRQEQMLLRSARTCRRLGLYDRARNLLWRLIGDLTPCLEPDVAVFEDEKGAPIRVKRGKGPAPTGVRKEAMYELVESWIEDVSSDIRWDEDAATEDKHRKWARTLAAKYAEDWVGEPRWMSFLLRTHTSVAPYVADPTKCLVQTCLVQRPESFHSIRHFQEQLAQLTVLSKTNLSFVNAHQTTGPSSTARSPPFKDHKTALVEALKQGADRPSSDERWFLVIEVGITFGPMFARDWQALQALLPILSSAWDVIWLGQDLPAVDLARAMCCSKQKKLVAVSTLENASQMGSFAYLIRSKAARAALAKTTSDDTRLEETLKTMAPSRHLALSPPTVFLPLV